MRYVIGVDGGQTSTVAAVLDETGTLLGVGRGGPANHIHESGGVARIQRSLKDAIESCLIQADLQNARIALTCLGMTGSSEQMEDLCAQVVPSDEMLFGHDTRIALYAVTGGEPGAVVIAGTGAAAFAAAPDGEEALVGGWGYLMGDEGSGYWIGLKALNCCAKAEDGRGNPTRLSALIKEQLEVQTMHEVHSMVYDGNFGRPEIASLALSVSLAAQSGDVEARAILKQAGQELAAAVCTAIEKVGMQQNEVVVGTAGSIFKAGRPLLHPFRTIVLKTVPKAQIMPPKMPAAVGAGLMALKQIGCNLHSELLQNLMMSLGRFTPMKS